MVALETADLADQKKQVQATDCADLADRVIAINTLQRKTAFAG